MESSVNINNTSFKALSKTIHANISNEFFGVDQLAEEMNMSRGHLYRKVKALTNHSPNQLIRLVRLYYGLELLESDNFRISEVAYKIGFNSDTYFIKCFSEYFGMSPGKYQQLAMLGEIYDESPFRFPEFMVKFRVSLERSNEKPLVQSTHTKGNLPFSVTRFFGRQDEMGSLKSLLKENKLVSIIGAAGYGKTRLALELGRTVQHHYPDGVWFINLAAVTNKRLVINAFMEATGSMEEKEELTLKKLTSQINSKELLFIVDNCEHLLVEVSRIITHLISFTLKPKFLITSREPLKSKGESTLLIPSLSIYYELENYDSSAFMQNESIQLFVDRARLIKHDINYSMENLKDIACICKKLEGIPLAIELAASRTRILQPSELLKRLEKEYSALATDSSVTNTRHKTLESAIDWSYALLNEDEKTLLLRLHIFPTDFDLISAEKVCGYGLLKESDIFDLLANLVDKSMVMVIENKGASRYKLLEVIKQYANHKLAKTDRTELVSNFTAYYFDMAENSFIERTTANQDNTLFIIHNNQNALAALDFLSDKPKQFAEMIGNISWVWYSLSEVLISNQFLNEALNVYPKKDHIRAKVLFGLGIIEAWYNDSPEARGIDKMDEAIDILQKQNRALELAILLPQYVWIKYVYLHLDEGDEIINKGFLLPKVKESKTLQVRYLLFKAWGLINRNLPTEAEQIINGIVDDIHNHGRLLDSILLYHLMGDIPLMKKEYVLAEKNYIISMKNSYNINNVLQSALDMMGIAMSVAGQERHKKAIRLVGAFTRKFEELGARFTKLEFWDNLFNETVGVSMSTISKDEIPLLLIEGNSMDYEEAMKYAATESVPNE